MAFIIYLYLKISLENQATLFLTKCPTLPGTSLFTLPRKGRILNRLEIPEQHPRVIGCDTLALKDFKFSNIHQTTNSLISKSAW